MKTFKETNLNNLILKTLSNEEMQKLFCIKEGTYKRGEKRVFHLLNIEDNSQAFWIIAFNSNDLARDNVVGFMELKRYLAVGNATMSDKEAIDFDYFNKNDIYKYVDCDGFEEELSQLDSFIQIENVEVLHKGLKIGTMLYKFLEYEVLTDADSLLESTRTFEVQQLP
jgi:hypothetical protein